MLSLSLSLYPPHPPTHAQTHLTSSFVLSLCLSLSSSFSLPSPLTPLSVPLPLSLALSPSPFPSSSPSPSPSPSRTAIVRCDGHAHLCDCGRFFPRFLQLPLFYVINCCLLYFLILLLYRILLHHLFCLRIPSCASPMQAIDAPVWEFSSPVPLGSMSRPLHGAQGELNPVQLQHVMPLNKA